MNFFYQSFYSFLYQPLLNGLVLLYLLTRDLGLAVFILTLLVRLALFPLSFKGLKSQQAIKKLDPKVREIKQKYKGDMSQQNKAIMELYKQEKISPASGCLPLLIQLPIIITLYKVFNSGLNADILGRFLYSFVPNPGEIHLKVFWLFDINSKFFIVALALLASALQFWQSKMAIPKGSQKQPGRADFSSAMQKQMLFIFPVITFFVIYTTGVVIGVYWFFSVLFSVIEYYITTRGIKEEKIYAEKNN